MTVHKLEMALVSLSLTVLTPTVIENPLWPKFLNLKNLAVHFRQCPRDKGDATLTRILETASQAPLESLTLHHVDRIELQPKVLQNICQDHRDTLRRLNVVGFDLLPSQLSTLPKGLPELEQLGFSLRSKQVRTSLS